MDLQRSFRWSRNIENCDVTLSSVLSMFILHMDRIHSRISSDGREDVKFRRSWSSGDVSSVSRFDGFVISCPLSSRCWFSLEANIEFDRCSSFDSDVE